MGRHYVQNCDLSSTLHHKANRPDLVTCYYTTEIDVTEGDRSSMSDFGRVTFGISLVDGSRLHRTPQCHSPLATRIVRPRLRRWDPEVDR